MNDKMKYYMRGLGFGIIITTIILSIVNSKTRLTDANAVQRVRDLGYTISVKEEEPFIDMDSLKNKVSSTPAPTATDIPANNEEVTATSTPTLTPTLTPTSTPTCTPTPTVLILPTATPIATPTNTPTPTVKPTLTPTSTSTPTPTSVITPTAKPTATPKPTNAAMEQLGSRKGVESASEPVTAILTVTKGMTCKKIVKTLVDLNIIEDGDSFLKYVIYTEMTRHISQGSFTLRSDMTYDEILKIVTKGRWKY